MVMSVQIQSSGLWHHAVLYMDTNVSEQHAASILRIEMSVARIWTGYICKVQRSTGGGDT
jgi:hypothetical protein